MSLIISRFNKLKFIIIFIYLKCVLIRIVTEGDSVAEGRTIAIRVGLEEDGIAMTRVPDEIETIIHDSGGFVKEVTISGKEIGG